MRESRVWGALLGAGVVAALLVIAGCNDDCATLTMSFVAPSGAHSLAFDFNFMSSEYPEWVGSQYNDSFQVSMSSPSNNFSNIVYDNGGHSIDINSVLFTQPCQQLTGT